MKISAAEKGRVGGKLDAVNIVESLFFAGGLKMRPSGSGIVIGDGKGLVALLLSDLYDLFGVYFPSEWVQCE